MKRDLPWIIVGAAIMILITAAALVFRREDGRVRQLASKAGKVDLVTGMRGALSAASEAEKSAVLATTDQDSQTYADQARARTAEVEQRRDELARLLNEDGTAAEKDLLGRFSGAFTEFRRVDEQLLALAVKNSNLKAYALAFGPAAQSVGQIDDALSRLIARSGDRPEAASVIRLASAAQSAALRIETLLPPHIAEPSDERMNELEAAMTRQDEAVRTALAGLRKLGDDADLETASSSYDRFSELRTQILALSRENTNVRSMTISLSDKKKVMGLCNASLDALEQEILAEAPVGVDYGRFGHPVKVR